MLRNASVNYQASRLPRILHSLLFIILFVCQESVGLQAESDPSFQSTADIISAVRTDALDYLKNPEKIESALALSESNNWEDLHLEAAAIYAELLFRQERYEEQIEHIEKYLAKVDPQDNRTLYLLFLESKIRYLARVKQKDQADAIVEEMEAMLLQLSSADKIIVYRSFAYHYTAFDFIESTLENAVRGLELSEALNDHGASGFFLQKISDAHNFLDKKEDAIDFARRAVAEYEKTQDEHLTAKSYWSLGNVLLELSKIEGGLFYFKRALSYFKAVGMQKGIVFAQYSIANIEHSRGKYEESLEILKDNIERAEKAGISDMQLASMILKVSVYAKQEKWNAANEVSDEILPLVDKFSRTHYKANYFMERYKLKKQTGRNAEAFDAIEQYIKFSEKHLKAITSDSVENLQSQLQLRQKEAEIVKLAQEKSITELRAKDESQEKIIWRLSAAVALLMLFALLLLFYWQLYERRKIHALSIRDDLTKAVNRRGILAMARQAIGEHNTIALVDLDYFKKVNDNFGHDTGDEVLIAFADAARISLRGTDSFGRYGGEEWLFIINSVDDKGIELVFDRLKKTYQVILKERNLGELSKAWSLTFSMGAIPCQNRGGSLEDIIKMADEMLYKAKHGGRDQLVIG